MKEASPSRKAEGYPEVMRKSEVLLRKEKSFLFANLNQDHQFFEIVNLSTN
jgi:hypothetical protein